MMITALSLSLLLGFSFSILKVSSAPSGLASPSDATETPSELESIDLPPIQLPLINVSDSFSSSELEIDNVPLPIVPPPANFSAFGNIPLPQFPPDINGTSGFAPLPLPIFPRPANFTPLMVPEWTTEVTPVNSKENTTACATCNLIVESVFTALELGLTDAQIMVAIIVRCTTMRNYSIEVCKGAAKILLPTIRYIYETDQVVQGNVCGILMMGQHCTLSEPEKLEFTIRPSPVAKPPVIKSSPPPTNSTTLKVIHLADIHWDPEYLEGSLANCRDPLCCRASSGPVNNTADAAGYWGDYRSCDLPWRTIENAVVHMAKQHSDAAYIIWTGDLVPHDMWSTTKEENLMINDKLLSLMKKHFPNTPLYPTVGNHESHPTNTFAPPEITDEKFSSNWLYNELDSQWSKWLPAEVSSTIRYGGYYTTLVRPGLRIVSLNTNYCYTLNWWTLFNSHDPASSLIWLSQTLEKSERDGEKVHIIAHIPPGGNDCWAIYSREFSKIINRFESTVAAQFYGHSHNEEFKIFYDSVNTSRPVNVAFIAGSLTTYSDLNPSYEVYIIDGPRNGSTWAVTDFSTWTFNVTEANLAGSAKNPRWFELYQAKKEYGLKDLSPQSMDNLFERMLTDEDLFKRFFKNYHKDADRVVAKGCNAKCRHDILCNLVTTNFADQEHCNRIQDSTDDLLIKEMFDE